MNINKQSKDYDKDGWETPDYIYNWLDRRFDFNLDGCADKDNHKTMCYSNDFLNLDPEKVIESMNKLGGVSNLNIFVNPPYSNVKPFLIKAKELRDQGCVVVFLLNADKSTRWYEDHVLNVANEVIDITGSRLAFIHPVTKEPVKGNSKGQMIVVFDPTMNDFVTRNVSLDFIKGIK